MLRCFFLAYAANVGENFAGLAWQEWMKLGNGIVDFAI
jgi:hypothetical protein